MKLDGYKCDMCDATKGDVNHWFLSDEWPGELRVYPWKEMNSAIGKVHLCGSCCVLKFVSEWLGRAA